MIRLLFLYSPAVVCALWAGAVAVVGHATAVIIIGALSLCVALVLHTCQSIRDARRRRRY